MNAEFQISAIILQQLGGDTFEVMTGATDFLTLGNDLQFKLPKRAKNGINYIKITLDGDDTYTVAFYNNRPRKSLTKVSEFNGIHATDLCKIFEEQTGLFTSL